MNIRNIRQKKGMLQTELADKVGVTQGMVSLWETGYCSPSLSSAQKLAEVLDCTIDELIEKPQEEEQHAL